MVSIEYIVLGVSVLLLLSIITSKALERLGIPALLLFLLIGMLAGSEGPGGIYFDDPLIAQSLGVFALVFILFSGGLDTDWRSVRPILWMGLSLATLGVLVTAVLVGLFATYVLDFSLLEGLLLGAVVSSTDAAAVFAVLRSKNISLKGKLKPLLEFESGSNDPMAVFLTIGFTSMLVNPTASPFNLIPMFIQQMILGAVMGYGLGKGIILIINHLRLGYDGLYPVLTFSLVLLVYGATASLGGNGFLAVYVAALVMGNSNFIHKKSLMRFHDGLAWLMQITMFLTLGLLVFPSHIVPIILLGLLVSLFLILIARPFSVFLILSLSRLDFREKAMVSWVGLRGAVPIILATFPLLADISKSEIIFNLVFFIVIISVLLQGTSLATVAKWLGVGTAAPVRSRYPLEFEPTDNIRSELIELEIPDNSPINGKQIVEINFPKNSLIVLLNRKNEFIIPKGGTVIEAGDKMLVLTERETTNELHLLIGDK